MNRLIACGAALLLGAMPPQSVAQPAWAGPPQEVTVDVSVTGTGTDCRVPAISRERSCRENEDDPVGEVCQYRPQGNKQRRIRWVSAEQPFMLAFDQNPFVPDAHCDLTTMDLEKTCKVRKNARRLTNGYKYDIVTEVCTEDPRVFLTR